MGWSIGHDSRWGKFGRDVGYGVPAFCDHPGCGALIDRGLAHVCAQEEPYGGENGCGLYFCSAHLTYHEDKDEEKSGFMCERCDEFHTRMGKRRNKDYSFTPFPPTPDRSEWVKFKLKDKSWKQWREENPDAVAELNRVLNGEMLEIDIT